MLSESVRQNAAHGYSFFAVDFVDFSAVTVPAVAETVISDNSAGVGVARPSISTAGTGELDAAVWGIGGIGGISDVGAPPLVGEGCCHTCESSHLSEWA